jgi:hypothetical protein
MKRFGLVGCLWLLAVAPAGAADYLTGDWFIVSGKSKLTSSIAGHALLKESAKWVKDGVAVRVLVLPADSAWLFRLSNNAWVGINLPSSLWDKNVALGKANHDIQAVALMAQGGWALLYDKGELATDGVPAGIRTQLQKAVNDLKKAGTMPRFIAFAPDGGWVVLGDKDYREHGLPKDLSQNLADHKEKAVPIRSVAFDAQGDWFVIDDHNECFTSKPGHAAYQKLKSLKSAGEQLRLITFTPGVYAQGYLLEHEPVRRIQAVMSMTFRCPDGKVDRWAVFPPAFPELPRQRAVKETLEPAGIAVEDDGLLHQKVKIIRASGKPKNFQAKASYELTLYTNRLVPLLAGQAPLKVELAGPLAKAFTHVTQDMTTKVFKDFVTKAQLHRGPKESDLALGRRTFLYISKNFKYIYPNIEGMDVIQCGKGDCGGLSWVFVRVMRANGVPARLLLGHWADSETPGKKGEPPDSHCHAKAEFFADGLGWVGADLSGGVGAEGNPLVCFGNEAGDFVVCDLDTDRVVKVWPEDPPTKLGGTQGFFWWFQGNEGKGIQTEEHWTVKTLDPHPQR